MKWGDDSTAEFHTQFLLAHESSAESFRFNPQVFICLSTSTLPSVPPSPCGFLTAGTSPNVPSPSTPSAPAQGMRFDCCLQHHELVRRGILPSLTSQQLYKHLQLFTIMSQIKLHFQSKASFVY